MKRVILSIGLMTMCVVTMFAQKGETAVGLNLGYGTEVKNVGIGAKFQYNVTDAIRLEPSFNYFLKKDGLSMWDLNANVHYLFPISSKFKVYPLAGLTYTSWKSDGFEIDLGEWAEYIEDFEIDSESTTTGKFGVNLGVGCDYSLTEKLNLNFELKYQIISDFSQLVFGMGVAYKF